MKILVLGPVASGKTTIARDLIKELNLPEFSIDYIVHDDEKNVVRTEEEQRKMINDIIKQNKEWIIEGMPRTHLEVLASAATTILYLDVEKKELRKRLFFRIWKNKLGIEKVGYKVDKKLIQRMKDYIENDNKEVLNECMKKYPSKLIILKNKKEYQSFINALKNGEELKYQ